MSQMKKKAMKIELYAFRSETRRLNKSDCEMLIFTVKVLAPAETAITARAPPIARYMLYEIFGDEQYEGAQKYHHLVLAHEPVHAKAVTYGRLINHSREHPNLVMRKAKYSCQTETEMHIVLILQASRNIRAGEQLLWDYWPYYKGPTIRDRCMCDPDLNAAASLTLAPVQPSITTNMIWDELGSMSQHAADWQLPPFTTRSLLMSVAQRADVAAMLEAPDAFDQARMPIAWTGAFCRRADIPRRRQSAVSSPQRIPRRCIRGGELSCVGAEASPP
ncbi:hypothetical protein Y032_0229g2929 [Ancylostoma ceylanicum]|uniref:SET domain-containing protein n=2 Tax=Ancylostoma ceylanicum TaxID=53326 RepID=A0A016SG42_9BILA|nr:hypothetical protein Y032_0229g2929 [Ancylostoma ceylanicum]